MKLVLDALIHREDFDVKDDSGLAVARNKMTISVPELEYDSFFFSAIKKPDFQRETNEWEPEKVYQLIKSFLEGELIPAVILWKSMSNFLFVIDGSHRLSALAAWINDDYGDGPISMKYFGSSIPKEQIKAAELARSLIDEQIGSYKLLKESSRKEVEDINQEMFLRAKSLGSLAIQVQWVEGNSRKAEDSFFRINQQASPINHTEIKLIKSRTKPNGLAARAISRSGTGHNYWSAFDDKTQTEIYGISKEINEMLFEPEFKSPIKTLDLPIGGRMFSDQGPSLILETINITNGLNGKGVVIPDDKTGELTVRYLKNCRRVLRRITSTYPGSLGLHPIVYFYSMRGLHKVASFYAILDFVQHLEKHKKFDDFTKVRKHFEEVMIRYEFLVQQIVRKYRRSTNGYKHIKDYYLEIVKQLLEDNDIDTTIDNIVKLEGFSYLAKEIKNKDEVFSKRFSDGRKSNVFIINGLKKALRCSICEGVLHSSSITIDHITRKEDGGSGSVDNGQLAHPYCNSTIKN